MQYARYPLGDIREIVGGFRYKLPASLSGITSGVVYF